MRHDVLAGASKVRDSLSAVTHSDRRDAGWDIVQGRRNYLVLLTAQLASAGLSFAAIWLSTRLLGSSGYGGLVAIVAASQAVGQLAVNWTAVSLSRYGVQEFVETGRIGKSFWTRLWIFLPNVALVIATSPLWLPPLSSALKLPPQAYLFVLSHFLANALWIHVQQGLQGAKLMRLQGSLLTFERGLVLLIVVVCYLSGRASFLTLALAYIFAPIGASLAGLWTLRKLVFPVSGVDRALLPRMLKFSLPILPASFVGYMTTNYLDAMFIAHYLSGAALGVYAVAYSISGSALQLPLLVGTVMMPFFVTLQVAEQDERIERVIQNVLPLLTLMWGVACAFLATIGGYFLPMILGVQFQGITELLWPLMAAAALAGPALMGYAPFSTAKAVTQIFMLSAAAAALVNVTLNYLLIPRYGLLGCAWGTTAAYGVNVLLLINVIDWKFLRTPTWTLQATLPAVLGAGFASWSGRHVTALVITVVSTILLAIVHHSSLIKGLKLINTYGLGVKRNVGSAPVEN